MQCIKVEQNLGESFELKPLTHIDTDQSSDDGKLEPNSCWKKTKLYFSSLIKSDDHSDVSSQTLEESLEESSHVWDPISNFFDYYKNHFNTMKFIGTNVCLSLVDVGSDINTAITFLM